MILGRCYRYVGSAPKLFSEFRFFDVSVLLLAVVFRIYRIGPLLSAVINGQFWNIQKWWSSINNFKKRSDRFEILIRYIKLHADHFRFFVRRGYGQYFPRYGLLKKVRRETRRKPKYGGNIQ